MKSNNITIKTMLDLKEMHNEKTRFILSAISNILSWWLTQL